MCGKLRCTIAIVRRVSQTFTNRDVESWMASLTSQISVVYMIQKENVMMARLSSAYLTDHLLFIRLAIPSQVPMGTLNFCVRNQNHWYSRPYARRTVLPHLFLTFILSCGGRWSAIITLIITKFFLKGQRFPDQTQYLRYSTGLFCTFFHKDDCKIFCDIYDTSNSSRLIAFPLSTILF